jgi:hypothetical protein
MAGLIFATGVLLADQQKATIGNYLKVELGVSFEQAREILGSPTREAKGITADKKGDGTYVWDLQDSKNSFLIQFSGGKLCSKKIVDTLSISNSSFVPVEIPKELPKIVKADDAVVSQTAVPINQSVKKIFIHPMQNLNFKTKAEIYEIRKKAVAEYPDLYKLFYRVVPEQRPEPPLASVSWWKRLLGVKPKAADDAITPEPYEPSLAVFGQIEDKKPWWGILGLCYYGSGELSIAGESGQSRFFLNPYLLVALEEAHAYNRTKSSYPPVAFYPKPEALTWKPDEKRLEIVYDVTGYWNAQLAVGIKKDAEEKRLTFVAYNARDFGYRYLYVVPEESYCMDTTSRLVEPIEIKQFIHCGNSCGYPGGCNNCSPTQPELNIHFEDVPAVASIKLWQEKPASVTAKEDLRVIIYIR